MNQSKYGSILRFAKIRYAVFIMIAIIVVGTLGYMLIEGTNFIDSLFMTVITVSTVGYHDVIHLDFAGKVFTIILILVSWVTFAYAISVITSHFVEGELGNIFASYRNKTKLKKMKNHIIVVGYGRNGRNASEYLLAHRLPFVILEKNHELISDNLSKDLHFLEGDATEDKVLLEANIGDAKAIITTLPVDADNLFVTLSARSLNKGIYIVSRSADDATTRKLLKAGANEAVMPESVGGHRMAMMVDQPDVVNFYEKISFLGDAETNLVEIQCSDMPSELINHTIKELGFRNNTGANIIGFKTPTGEFVINPNPNTIIESKSKLFVLGNPSQIKSLKEILNIH